jgi:hypothetical protein
MIYFWLKNDEEPESGFVTTARAVTEITGISAYYLRGLLDTVPYIIKNGYLVAGGIPVKCGKKGNPNLGNLK